MIETVKNNYDPIGNRTRDLPDCSAVPQPTQPPLYFVRTILLKLRDPTPSMLAHGGTVAPWILTCQVQNLP